MDMRYEMRGDGRRLPPRNARGEFTRRGRGRGRRDRGMYDMGYDMRGGDYGDYARDMARGRGMGGHYPQGQGSTYYPIQAMGTFEGYYGMPEQDFARGGRGGDRGYDMAGDMDYRNYDMRRGDRGYGYDMRGGRDYGYVDMGDYGDYGETLSKQELEHWCEKLKRKMNEQEKQMFHKNMIAQKAKQLGVEMKEFGEEELEVVTLMLYDDYKKSLGQNPDIYIKLAGDWLDDKDASVKGAEKLAVYFDEIVMGGEE